MELENRKKVLHIFNENQQLSSSAIAKQLKMPKSTVSYILRRFKETLTVERAPHTRKSGPINKELARKVTRSFKDNPGLSDRDRARRYGTSRTTVMRLRSAHGYKSYRMIKHPNRTDKQNLMAKSPEVLAQSGKLSLRSHHHGMVRSKQCRFDTEGHEPTELPAITPDRKVLGNCEAETK